MKEEKTTQKELEEYKNQAKKYLSGWKRERADFLNFKKNEAERIKKAIVFAREEMILEILLILDNIYLAEKEIPKELRKNSWVLGMMKIKDQLLDFLKRQEVEEIDCLNKSFNPYFHEAVEHVDSKKESGTITEILKKGYILNNKVIRPAKVKISK